MAKKPKLEVPPKPILRPFTPEFDPYEDEFSDPNPMPASPDEVRKQDKRRLSPSRVASMSQKNFDQMSDKLLNKRKR